MRKTWWLLLIVLLVALCAAIGADAETDGWVKEGNYLCYYKDGAKVTGTQTINNYVYYFTDEGYLKHNGQVQNARYYGTVYVDENNELVMGWNTIKGNRYYFFPDSGKAAVYNYNTYSVEIDGEKYVFDYNGVLKINSWYNSVYGNEEGKTLSGYQTIGDHKYLFGDTGRVQTGFHEIEGGIHYFHDWGDADSYEALGWTVISDYIYYFDPQTGAMQISPRTIDGTPYSFNNDGSLIHNKEVILKFIDGRWYAYNESNTRLSGWVTIEGYTYYFASYAYTDVHYLNGYYYYFDETGKMQQNLLAKTKRYEGDNSEALFYYGADGKRVFGWQTIDGSKYYISEDGAYIGGWGIENDNYYFNEEGKMQTNYLAIIDEYGHKYISYYGSDGKGVTGWKTVGEDTYYFNSNAYIGEYQIDGDYYYFDENGRMQKNYLRKGSYPQGDGSIYEDYSYYGADGKRISGWTVIDGETYYFDTCAYIGEHEIDNKYYYFNKEGKLQKNIWRQDKNDNIEYTYYYGTDGTRVQGWTELNGETYYFQPYMYTDVWEIDGNYYCFDEKGRLQKNLLKKTRYYQWDTTEHLYYYGTDGKRVFGWQTINGSKYYFDNYEGAYYDYKTIGENCYFFNEKGEMQSNFWWETQAEDGSTFNYYFGSDGKEASGWLVLNGNTYYFEPFARTDVWCIDDNYYYFDIKGRMQKNLLKKTKVYEGDNTEGLFYYGNDGKRVYGWYELNGDTYYFDYYGAATGTYYTDGKEYKFSDDGKLLETIIHAQNLKVEPIFLSLLEGETAQLTPIYIPEDTTDKRVKWQSYDEDVAQVDSTGKVTALSPGQAYIYVQLESSIYWSGCNVYVYSSDNGVDAYVARCYQIILGRAPDWEGMETWINELYSGRRAAAEIIEQFIASAEFKKKRLSNSDAVEVLYKAMLGRPSDAAGKDSWVEKLNAGQHITAVINGFCGSAEFRNICDSYGIAPGSVTVQESPVQADDEKIEAYVTRCYQIILGRGADEGGLNTWMDELTSGRKAAAEIIEQFVASAEFQNKNLSNGDSVEILYKAMLGRGSDPAGKASWVEKLDAGQDLTAVINGFCGSAEFKAICDSYGIQPGTVTVKQPTAPAANDEKIQAFVARCYKIILGRDADEGGMNTWFNELKSGRKAAAEIIESFVNSQEFKNKNYSNADAVEILYKAMLGRGSDPAGKADWVEKLNAGQPLEAVINGFCGSAEFKAICDAYGITPGTVNVPQLSKMAVMQEVPAEKPVVKETVNNVTKVEITNASDTVNENLGTAVQAIYINEEKAKEFIGRCYQAILGREASQAELDSWIGQMMNGSKTADQIARGFLFSGEFKGRNIGNEELVKILYRVYMNREADAEGLATWTQKLDEGTSLNDLLDIFAKTNEFKAVVRNMAQ